jgi:GSCFA family
MVFRTVLLAKKEDFDCSYQTPTLAIGSCFAENMAARLSDLRFPVYTNPFGILYNPISIVNCLNYLMIGENFTEKDIFENHGLWHSWQHHGKFSSPKKAEILRGVNEQLSNARQFFKKANRLIVTLGTANVFIETEAGQVVANCHKMPASHFQYKRLSIAEIVEPLNLVFDKIIAQNIDCQIIITISPIRHIRDGLIENQRSKASLLLATEILCQQFANVHYFPAYEIMMDDLRDYRFYEADMIHPSKQAIDYIWQAFSDTFFTDETKKIMDEVHKINLMQQHRPLHPDTEGYQQFVNSLKKREEALNAKYPFLDNSPLALYV